MKKIRIIRFARGKKKRIIDHVTQETTLRIHVNNHRQATLACSPHGLKELSLGFLYACGRINSMDEVKKITIKKEKGFARVYCFLRRTITQRNVVKRKPSERSAVCAENVIRLMRQFQRASTEFKRTGGVHSAALCSKKKIVFMRDDLGRHNAIDKVIGQAVLRGIYLHDKMLLTSGRIPAEVAQKIQRCRIPIIVSVSAPTDQAVRICRAAGITLLGFARGTTMNIYSGEERIR